VHDDELTADMVSALVREHDRRMEDERASMSLVKATCGGRFWEWVYNEGKTSVGDRFKMFDDRYEVNLLMRGINAYHAALFPHRMACLVSRTAATGEGDADKAQLALSRWMFSSRQRSRINSGVRQALMYPGVGFKVFFDPNNAAAIELRPQQRVGMRVVPWWELLLDHEANDPDDARFFGHLFYKPLTQVAEEYDLDPEELSGTRQEDFLSHAFGDRRATPGDPEAGPAPSEARYVQVLELCNLVDHLEGNDYPGRFEVHIIGQGELSREPVYTGELPLWDSDGRPLPNIATMCFETEPEYPYRGIAPARSWMHQQAKLNADLSAAASMARKDKRIALWDRKLGSDVLDKIHSARDVEGIPVDTSQLGKDLSRVFTWVTNPPVSVNIREDARMARADMLGNFNLSPSAVGITQNITAQEIRYQRDFTDSEFGRYADARDRCLAQIAKLALAAHVAAMLDPGDSAGVEEDQDPLLETSNEGPPEDAAETLFESEDAEVEEEPEDDEVEEEPEDDEVEEEEEPLDEDLSEAAAEEEPEESPEDSVEDEMAEVFETEQQEIVLLNARGEDVVIGVSDLDAEFDIGFNETGRTPATDAEVRANLTQVLPQYLQLWQMIEQGGAAAVVAEEAARALYNEYRLPENLDPERIRSQLADKKTPTAEPTPAAEGSPATPAPEPAGGGSVSAPPQQAPPQQAPPEQAPPQMDLSTAVQQIDAALTAAGREDLRSALAQLTNLPPEVLVKIGPLLLQVASMPAEQIPEALTMLLQQLQAPPEA